MRVPMQSDFMPFFDNLAYLLRERLCGMRRCEPCCLDIVLIPEFEETVDPNGCSKDAPRDVSWVGWSSGTGVEPANAVNTKSWCGSVQTRRTSRSRRRCQCHKNIILV